MKFDCESVEFVIKYDDNGVVIRIYVETKENPKQQGSGNSDTQ